MNNFRVRIAEAHAIALALDRSSAFRSNVTTPLDDVLAWLDANVVMLRIARDPDETALPMPEGMDGWDPHEKGGAD
jgi:hypothetical protein